MFAFLNNFLPLTISLIFLFAFSGCGKDVAAEKDYKMLRNQMINTQIKARGIKDKRVLKALLEVERHKFMPQKYRRFAYNDHPVPIGEGQTISQPYIVALMTEELRLKGNEKVLEIGTGSGYQAAVLSKLCAKVFSIEIFETLGEKAKKLLLELGFDNVKIKIGDGHKGWKKHAPFDAIIVTCAPANIPAPLIKQLKEGGRMIIPVGMHVQELILLTKKNGKIIQEKILPVRFVPMLKKNGGKAI